MACREPTSFACELCFHIDVCDGRLDDVNDVLLVVLGAVLGAALAMGGKALIDPLLARRAREINRVETWLEDAVKHADEIQAHIQEVRNAVSSAMRFDADAIAATIAHTLTSRWGPEPLRTAASHTDSEKLAEYSRNASDAWIAVGVARTDAEHGVMSEDALYQPLYAVQRYQTQVGNFEHEARKILSGRL